MLYCGICATILFCFTGIITMTSHGRQCVWNRQFGLFVQQVLWVHKKESLKSPPLSRSGDHLFTKGQKYECISISRRHHVSYLLESFNEITLDYSFTRHVTVIRLTRNLPSTSTSGSLVVPSSPVEYMQQYERLDVLHHTQIIMASSLRQNDAYFS